LLPSPPRFSDLAPWVDFLAFFNLYLSASLFPFFWARERGFSRTPRKAAAQFFMLSMPAEENTSFCTTTFPPCPQRQSLSFLTLSDLLPLSFPSLGRVDWGVFGFVSGRACRFWVAIDTSGGDRDNSLSLRYISSMV